MTSKLGRHAAVFFRCLDDAATWLRLPTVRDGLGKAHAEVASSLHKELGVLDRYAVRVRDRRNRRVNYDRGDAAEVLAGSSNPGQYPCPNVERFHGGNLTCALRYEQAGTPRARRFEQMNQKGSIMEKAAICYRGEVLEAWEHEDGWTVRLGELEAASRYLDLALAALLDDGERVHELAARLLVKSTGKASIKADEPVAAYAQSGTRTKIAAGGRVRAAVDE